jgi:hypothetical protein
VEVTPGTKAPATVDGFQLYVNNSALAITNVSISPVVTWRGGGWEGGQGPGVQCGSVASYKSVSSVAV